MEIKILELLLSWNKANLLVNVKLEWLNKKFIEFNQIIQGKMQSKSYIVEVNVYLPTF